MGCAPFTTDPFTTGPFTTRLVVKGSVIIIIIIIMIVIIVFGICVRFFLSISWSGVIMMVVYEEVDSETDMVADYVTKEVNRKDQSWWLKMVIVI